MSAPTPVLYSSTPNALLPFPTTIQTACLIAAAKVFIGVPEQGGNNHGQMVEIFLHGVGLSAGEPWCAAFVHHVGFWSQFDPDTGHSAWPLPATATGFACTTIEGNTNDDGSSDGWKTAIKYRRLSHGGPDRFIRWSAIVGTSVRATFPQFRRGISARMVVRLNRIALRRLRTWLEQGGAHHGL